MDYNGDASSYPIRLANIKIHLNSTISTDGARLITLDIIYFYSGTPMGKCEYVCTLLKYIPEEIIHQYNLVKLQSMVGSTWKPEK